MSELISTRYTCDQCTTTRAVQFRKDEQNDQIFVPKTNNQNGLLIYSDIHRCEDGFLGINNLHIDKNNAVRSYEYLSLPSEKKKRNIIPGIPSPKTVKEKFKTLRVTAMNQEGGFRLRIVDKHLDIILIVGDVVVDEEFAKFSVISNNGGIFIDYYESEIETTEHIQLWFKQLANILVNLPPTKLGLFIDTLRYIQNLIRIPPASFHLNMLKTILSSHDITISLKDRNKDFNEILDQNIELYGEETVEIMKSLMVVLFQTPAMSLQQFTKKSNKETSDLVYLFLLLEQDDLIEIDRPDEIDVIN